MTCNRLVARISDAFGALRRDGRIVAAVQASAWTRTPMSPTGDPVGPQALHQLRSR